MLAVSEPFYMFCVRIDLIGTLVTLNKRFKVREASKE